MLRYYDLYQRLQLQFHVLLMMGAMDTRNKWSIFTVNKCLLNVASCWILSVYYKGVLERMPRGILSSSPKWVQAASNTYCNYEVPIVIHVCTLRYSKVTCKSKTTCRRTDGLYHFRFAF